mmetsp:Transcript_14794/g.29684  ORF Transcript_14794/g.29684 Transcript_14794/m.29684 type:complete len:201 (-) Transcript_14794:2117-2719(-)
MAVAGVSMACRLVPCLPPVRQPCFPQGPSSSRVRCRARETGAGAARRAGRGDRVEREAPLLCTHFLRRITPQMPRAHLHLGAVHMPGPRRRSRRVRCVPCCCEGKGQGFHGLACVSGRCLSDVCRKVRLPWRSCVLAINPDHLHQACRGAGGGGCRAWQRGRVECNGRQLGDLCACDATSAGDARARVHAVVRAVPIQRL